MPCEDLVDVTRMMGNIGRPSAEAAVIVDGANPFGQKLALGLLFLGVLAFHF